jgi:hypothetical protein
MTAKQTVCDACEKAIDTKNGALSFVPLRGGLTFTAQNAVGTASTDITQELNFCGPDCLLAWAEKTISAIKAPATPAAK